MVLDPPPRVGLELVVDTVNSATCAMVRRFARRSISLVRTLSWTRMPSSVTFEKLGRMPLITVAGGLFFGATRRGLEQIGVLPVKTGGGGDLGRLPRGGGSGFAGARGW